jgi:hypothetical protein
MKLTKFISQLVPPLLRPVQSAAAADHTAPETVQLYQDGQLSRTTALSRLQKQVPGIGPQEAEAMLQQPSGMLPYQEQPQEGGYGGPGGKKGGPPPLNPNYRIRARGNPIDELGLFFGAGDVVKMGMEGGKRGVEKRIQGIGRTEDGFFQIFFTDGTLMVSRQENGNDLWTRITRYDGRKNMLGKVEMPIEGNPGVFTSDTFVNNVKGKKEYEVLFKNGRYVGYPKGAPHYAGPGSRPPDGTPPTAPPGSGGNGNPTAVFDFFQGNPFPQIQSPAAPEFTQPPLPDVGTGNAPAPQPGTPSPSTPDVIFEPREGYHWDGTFDQQGRPRYVRDNMPTAAQQQAGMMPPGGMPMGNQNNTMMGQSPMMMGAQQPTQGPTMPGPVARPMNQTATSPMQGASIVGPQAITLAQRQAMQQQQQAQQPMAGGGGMMGNIPSGNPGSTGSGALDPMLYITGGNTPTRGRIGNRVFGDPTSTANKGDPSDTKSGTQGYLSAEAGGDIVSLPGVGQVALDYLAGKINYREMYDRLNRLTGEPRSNRALGEFTRREGRLPLPFGASIDFLISQGRPIPQGGGPNPLPTSRPGSKNGPRTSTGNVRMSGNVQNIYQGGGGMNDKSNPKSIRDPNNPGKYIPNPNYVPPGGMNNNMMMNQGMNQGGMNQQMNMAAGNEMYGGNPPPVSGYGTARRGMPENFFGVQQGDVVTLNAGNGVSLVENGAYKRTNGYSRGYVKPSLNRNGVVKRVQGFGYSPGGVAQIFFTDGTIAQDRADPRGGSTLKAALSAGGGGGMAGGVNPTAMGGTMQTQGTPATGFGPFQNLQSPTLEDVFGASTARTAEFGNFVGGLKGSEGRNVTSAGRGFLQSQFPLALAGFGAMGALGPTPNNTFGEFLQTLGGNIGQTGFGGSQRLNDIFGGLNDLTNMLSAGPNAANLSTSQRLAIDALTGDPNGQLALALQPSMWALPTRFRSTFQDLAGQRFDQLLASRGAQDPLSFQFLPELQKRGFSFF